MVYAEEHHGIGPVLFNPTIAAAQQFRATKEDALSYCVAGHIPEDGGFAINPWVDIHFDNACVNVEGDIALAMGNYVVTDPSGNEVKVEYSFGYIKDHEGKLRIVLHHSSVTFSG